MLLPGFILDLVWILCLRNSRVHGVQSNVNNLRIGNFIRELGVIPDDLNEVLVDADLITVQRIFHIQLSMMTFADKFVFLQIVSFKVVFGSADDQSDLFSSFFSRQGSCKLVIMICGSIYAKESSQVMHSIGSTAVQEIWAKNIVDVMIEIPQSADVKDIAQILVLASGIEGQSESGLKGQYASGIKGQ